jgi:hypothetical protein
VSPGRPPGFHEPTRAVQGGLAGERVAERRHPFGDDADPMNTGCGRIEVGSILACSPRSERQRPAVSGRVDLGPHERAGDRHRALPQSGADLKRTIGEDRIGEDERPQPYVTSSMDNQ